MKQSLTKLFIILLIFSLIPFSLFIAIGDSIDFNWQRAASVPQTTISYVENISRPFGSINSLPAIPEVMKPDRAHWIPIFLYAIWLCGLMAVLLLYLTRGLRLGMARRRAKPLTDGRTHEVLRSLEISSGLRKRMKLASSASSMSTTSLK